MTSTSIEITPLTRALDATTAVPGSKSYTNRALLVAALADGRSTLSGALFSDDTDYMFKALAALGIGVEADPDAACFSVDGQGGRIPANGAEIYIGNSGTTSRSIISCVALGEGRFVIDGDAPMRESRPIEDLLQALRNVGVDARSQKGNGCLPVVVEGDGFRGGRTLLNPSKSSQFLTSLMLAGPCTREGLEIEMEGEYKTQYIDITMAVMRAFGARVEHDDYRVVRIEGGQTYQARDYHIEPDASNASYFFAAAALCGGRVRVNGLSDASMQGDIRFVDVLEQMGAKVERGPDYVEVQGSGELAGIDIDMREISDTSLTLAALAPFATGPVHIRNIEHSRWQETDRVKAMATELARLGVKVEERRDGISVQPSAVRPAAIDTYEDHRVAMAFSLVGLKVPGVRINDPACVNKTFPTYFDVLETLRG